MESSVTSLVELAALETLDVIGHELMTITRLRDRRPASAAPADWRTEAPRTLAWDLESLIMARLTERFPDHAVIGADRPSALATRWRWLVGVADTERHAGDHAAHLVSIALLSGDTPRVGALVDLANGDIIVGHRRTALDAPGQDTEPHMREGDRRLFLETGRSSGGRWEAAALARLATARRLVPRMLGSAPAALLAASRGGGTVLAVGVHERELAAGVLVAEQAGLESVWWRDAWPLAHVLVGRPDDLVPLVPAAAEVVRTWTGALMPAIPTVTTEWAI